MPLRLVLARNDEVAVALVDVVAYSTGFTLRLVVRVHPEGADFDPRQLMMQVRGGPMGSSDDQLRFGIEFADGRKATNLGQRGVPGDEPPSINMTPQGGSGGGGRSWETGYWVYPLPPTGPLTVAIAWPTHGLSEQTHTLDSTPIIEAAAASLVLWEDNRPIRSAGTGPRTSMNFSSARAGLPSRRP